jgi:hypothetical protein
MSGHIPKTGSNGRTRRLRVNRTRRVTRPIDTSNVSFTAGRARPVTGLGCDISSVDDKRELRRRLWFVAHESAGAQIRTVGIHGDRTVRPAAMLVPADPTRLPSSGRDPAAEAFATALIAAHAITPSSQATRRKRRREATMSMGGSPAAPAIRRTDAVVDALQSRPGAAFCDWCREHPTRSCRACNARRRRAARLVEGHGLSIAEAARRMCLPVARVQRLLEEEADRRELTRYRQTHVDNAPLRDLFEKRRLDDPALTTSEMARRIGTSAAQVERWLGLRATAAKTDHSGHTYPARVLTSIPVESAGRLARAMGYAPCEIQGC